MVQQVGPMAVTPLGEDEQWFRDTVRRFATEQIGPLVRGMDEVQQMDPGLIQKLFDLGLMGIEVPEEYGGAGGTFFQAILAVEEISAVDPSVGVMVDVQNTLCINALIRWATGEQKERYLTRLATDTIGSYALSEAGSGSDAFALQMRAEKRGDYYLLNGQKLWITNAREAGLFIVFATLDPSAGYKGITAFLVATRTPGFSGGKKEDKLGLRPSSSFEIILEDCKVPAANVLGEPGKGYKIGIEPLNEGRIGIAGQMLGLAQGPCSHAARYAFERKQFGKAIGEFQAVQFDLAEMATEIEATRLMVYNCARLKDNGLAFLKEAAMCKDFSSQVAERVASQAVEVFGGYGFVKDYPVEKYYRDAKSGNIYKGASNMQLTAIAKLMLGNQCRLLQNVGAKEAAQ